MDHYYPVGYGTTCDSWDETMPPYCATKEGYVFKDAPGWCREAWCYVEKGCKRDDVEPSAFFGTDTDLWYSYGNCGAQDSFSDNFDVDTSSTGGRSDSNAAYEV